MPARSEPATPESTARLRRLRAEVGELPVQALLGVRAAIDEALAADLVLPAHVEAVLRAARSE